jgi:hypothetical protein
MPIARAHGDAELLRAKTSMVVPHVWHCLHEARVPHRLVVLRGGPFVLWAATKNPKNDALDLTLRSGMGGVNAI